MVKEWFGILIGGYFAAMGVFAFGCAGGNCYGGNCNTPINNRQTTSSDEMNYEEVK